MKKIKELPTITESQKLDMDVKRAAIKEIEYKGRIADSNAVMEKIKGLRDLLEAIRPGEARLGIEGTNWIPAISQDWEIEAIEKKIIKLIEQL